MSKIIKKTNAGGKPVVIGKTVVGRSSSDSKGDGWQSLAFTKAIKSEIETWRSRAKNETRFRGEAHDRELEKTYREGYDKGFTDGIQSERDDRMKSIDTLLREAKNKSRNAIRNLEIKVVDLAVVIAEQIMRKSIKTDPEIVEKMVTETMSHIIGSEVVVLKVSVDDYTVVNSKYNQWLSLSGGAGEFKIEIDKRLRTGDFIVETEGGIIDAVINDRINVLVEELIKISD